MCLQAIDTLCLPPPAHISELHIWHVAHAITLTETYTLHNKSLTKHLWLMGVVKGVRASRYLLAFATIVDCKKAVNPESNAGHVALTDYQAHKSAAAKPT